MLGIRDLTQTRTDTEVPGLMGLATFTFGLSPETQAQVNLPVQCPFP